MKNKLALIITILGVMFLIFFFAMAYDNIKKENEQKELEYETNYDSYETINFDTIDKAITNNNASAKNQYQDKIYIFEGEVTRISDKNTIDVEQFYDDYGLEVTVRLKDSQESKVLSLNKGDHVKFFGKVNLNVIFGFMEVDDAIIIE